MSKSTNRKSRQQGGGMEPTGPRYWFSSIQAWRCDKSVVIGRVATGFAGEVVTTLLTIAIALGVLGSAGVCTAASLQELSWWWLLLPVVVCAGGTGGYMFYVDRERSWSDKKLAEFKTASPSLVVDGLRTLSSAELTEVAAWPTEAIVALAKTSTQAPLVLRTAAAAAGTVHEAPTTHEVLQQIIRIHVALSVDGDAAVRFIADTITAPTDPRVTKVIEDRHDVLRRELQPYADDLLAELRVCIDTAGRAETLDDDEWKQLRSRGDRLRADLVDLKFHTDTTAEWLSAVNLGDGRRVGADQGRKDDTIALLENYAQQRFSRSPLDLTEDAES